MDYENAKPIMVTFDAQTIYVTLADGRVIGNPINWFVWLQAATPEQRANVILYYLSVWWPDLDEGLDIGGMMQGVQPKVTNLT